MLIPGDPFPPLSVRTSGNPDYALDSTGGRYVVISFIAGTQQPGAAEFLRHLYASGTLFDDVKATCFVVSASVDDARAGAIAERIPGIRVAWDLDQRLARTCGILEHVTTDTAQLRLMTYVLDPGQRVLKVIPIPDLHDHFAQVRAAIDALPDPALDHDSSAPVLVVPNLLEPQLCADYIAYARRAGLEDSGFMIDDPRTGQTIGMVDHRHKRRFDSVIEDRELQLLLQSRVLRRLAPQIEKAFQFKISRMERYLVACYDGASGGWFRPHKDNTTAGTAHRRFAVTISLNDDYEGGGLRFPEFGSRIYRVPVGGAVVFSCSLLHEAVPVTAGERWALLPFLYDEVAAQVRLDNARHFADPEVGRAVVASVRDGQPGAGTAATAPVPERAGEPQSAATPAAVKPRTRKTAALSPARKPRSSEAKPAKARSDAPTRRATAPPEPRSGARADSAVTSVTRPHQVGVAKA